ncbi:MAG: lipoate--protein ligase family protein [Roseimicrobium sp.]
MMLRSVCLWHDTTARNGPMNMAVDEVLLRGAEKPWLRFYRWSEPSVSIGFSQDYEAVAKQLPAYPVVRRWTGGGVVVHESDWTYTLIVPRQDPVCELRPVETYRRIHEALISALHQSGSDGCALQPESTSDGRGVCFVEPAQFDVMRDGVKIAGAAQRRSKLGFLHQASVQQVVLPQDFGFALARELAEEIEVVTQSDAESQVLAEAQALAVRRYGTSSWLHHRREETEATSP